MSSLKLVIGNKNYSTWSLRPWFLLKQLDIPLTEEMVFLFEEDTNEKLEPYFSNHKVSVLVDVDLTVWDTMAIIEYIADFIDESKSTKSVWPRDNKVRAKARAVVAEMHSSFGDLRNAFPMNIRKHFPNYPITDPVQKDLDRIFALWGFCRGNKIGVGPWLFGDFTATDAMFAPLSCD